MTVDRQFKNNTPYPKTKRYTRLLKYLPQQSPHTRVCGMRKDFNKNKSILNEKTKIRLRKTPKTKALTYQRKNNITIPTVTAIKHSLNTLHQNKDKTTNKSLNDTQKHTLLTLNPLRTKTKTYPKPHINTHKLRRLLNPHTYKTKYKHINQIKIKQKQKKNISNTLYKISLSHIHSKNPNTNNIYQYKLNIHKPHIKKLKQRNNLCTQHIRHNPYHKLTPNKLSINKTKLPKKTKTKKVISHLTNNTSYIKQKHYKPKTLPWLNTPAYHNQYKNNLGHTHTMRHKVRLKYTNTTYNPSTTNQDPNIKITKIKKDLLKHPNITIYQPILSNKTNSILSIKSKPWVSKIIMNNTSTYQKKGHKDISNTTKSPKPYLMITNFITIDKTLKENTLGTQIKEYTRMLIHLSQQNPHTRVRGINGNKQLTQHSNILTRIKCTHCLPLSIPPTNHKAYQETNIDHINKNLTTSNNIGTRIK